MEMLVTLISLFSHVGGRCPVSAYASDDREQNVGDLEEAIRGKYIGQLGTVFRTATTTGEGCR